MKIRNKRGITDLYAFLLLMGMLLGMASLLYVWVQDMEQRVQQEGSAKTTGMLQATAFNVRVLTINSTNDGVVLENKGPYNVTEVTIWVNGTLVAMNLQLPQQIAPSTAGLMPLNTTITGQNIGVKILAVDSQGTATVVQTTLSAS